MFFVCLEEHLIIRVSCTDIVMVGCQKEDGFLLYQLAGVVRPPCPPLAREAVADGLGGLHAGQG